MMVEVQSPYFLGVAVLAQACSNMDEFCRGSRECMIVLVVLKID